MQDPCRLVTTPVVNARSEHEDTIEPATLGTTPSSADALEESTEAEPVATTAAAAPAGPAVPAAPGGAAAPSASRWPMWILGLVIMIDQIDHGTLRRYLVDEQFMSRTAYGVYWRAGGTVS